MTCGKLFSEWKVLIEHEPEAWLLFRANQQTVYRNQVARELTGLPAETNWGELATAPEYYRRLLDVVSLVLKTGKAVNIVSGFKDQKGATVKAWVNQEREVCGKCARKCAVVIALIRPVSSLAAAFHACVACCASALW